MDDSLRNTLLNNNPREQSPWWRRHNSRNRLRPRISAPPPSSGAGFRRSRPEGGPPPAAVGIGPPPLQFTNRYSFSPWQANAYNPLLHHHHSAAIWSFSLLSLYLDWVLLCVFPCHLDPMNFRIKILIAYLALVVLLVRLCWCRFIRVTSDQALEYIIPERLVSLNA